MIFALILLVLLLVSLAYNAGNFFTNLMGGHGVRYTRSIGPRLEEVTYEDHGSANKIAVIEVSGIITSEAFSQGSVGMPELIKAQLKHAEEDDRVRAVLLKVDSPGGEVLASDEIYRRLARFQETTRKPIIASMGSLAASGGYYVSAPCRWIVANDMTLTGSIGVILSTWNYRGLMDKVGVRPMTYKSGKFKDMLSGSREPDTITPQETNMVQNLINETYARFKTVVQQGRDTAYQKNKNSADKGRQLAEDWQEYADGRVLSGNEAYKLGFVDELGGFEKAVDRAKSLAGISSANLIEYQQRIDFSDIFRLFGKSETRAIKVDVGLDPPRLKAGQLYFLSPSYVN